MDAGCKGNKISVEYIWGRLIIRCIFFLQVGRLITEGEGGAYE